MTEDTAAPDSNHEAGQSSEGAQRREEGKNPAAVELGRLGGLKGGKARAAKLSQARKSEISRNAARVRWGKNRG